MENNNDSVGVLRKKKRGRGRPPGRRLRFNIKLLPEIDEVARKLAAIIGIPKSHYIEMLIAKDWERYIEGRIRKL